jgi:FAD/FMN-containing dehydrogenase
MDLAGFFVGTEGTLGIVTKATLRILPFQEKVVTQLALFPSVADAARAVSGIMAAGILPAALELLDKKVMGLVDRFHHVGYPAHAGASLIIEMDGLREGMELELRRVQEVCQANQALDIQTAETEEEAAKLWLSRRAAYGAMARLSPTVYVMDCAVPRNLLAEAIGKVIEIAEGLGLDVVTVAHAGDGNLHPLIPFDQDDPVSREKALQAHHEVMRMCVELGGTITGEHGVGVEKQEELALMYSEDELAVMRAVKEELDPGDLHNPRKIFPLRYFEPSAPGEPEPPAPPPGGKP